MIAKYIRLSSQDDDRRADETLESNSVVNQRRLLDYYIKSDLELSNAKTVEFCDDGHSGTNFDRPGVQALLERARRGEIECVRTHCDSWYSGKVSLWHKEIQSLFPKHCQEIVVWNSEHTEYHIADVVFSDAGRTYVIEFQHSAISHDEFIERTSFYLNCGYSLIWIFDYCEIRKQKRIYYSDGKHAGEIRVIWPGKEIEYGLWILSTLAGALTAFISIFILVRAEGEVYGVSGRTTPHEKFGNTVIRSTENSFISSLT